MYWQYSRWGPQTASMIVNRCCSSKQRFTCLQFTTVIWNARMYLAGDVSIVCVNIFQDIKPMSVRYGPLSSVRIASLTHKPTASTNTKYTTTTTISAQWFKPPPANIINVRTAQLWTGKGETWKTASHVSLKWRPVPVVTSQITDNAPVFSIVCWS